MSGNQLNSNLMNGAAVAVCMVIVFYLYKMQFSSACEKDCEYKYKDCKTACGSTEKMGKPKASKERMKKPTFGSVSATPDRVSEKTLEAFLSVRKGDDAVYEFSDPHEDPHGQMLASDDDKGWNPAQFSLDKDTYDSHQEFVKEAYISSTGAKAGYQVRDDFNPPNRWVGLRRPDLTSLIVPADARQQPSEYQNQMETNHGEFSL